MPRRLRIEVCGYHHIYNRGVAKSKVFLCFQDKEKFLEILGEVCSEYKFNIHSFCLMDNHYHLLLENQNENLSDGMRQINSRYAIYFNKKYKRVGHLWQDRFKSWFVLDEAYLFTLFRYIEANPVKAKMARKIGEYRYSAAYSILRDGVPPFLRNSFVLREYDTSEIFEAISIELSQEEIENLNKFHKTRYSKTDDSVTALRQKELKSYFKDIESKDERNLAILEAHKDNYTKTQIARELSLSLAGVCKIIKKCRV
jgi:REP element-mobilizing transposase RayT